jgi:NADPH-dependent 2,4-dienoyl-CoA reductase/sulfur reductase-like enzyme
VETPISNVLQTVTRVDPTNKRVVFTDNQATEDELFYDELILAPGGQPRRLPIEGANLSNVYTLRNFQDAQAIRDACVEGQRAVVIGTSFISMELVNAIGKKKLQSLYVIGIDEVPFQAVLGKEVGQGLMQVCHLPRNHLCMCTE